MFLTTMKFTLHFFILLMFGSCGSNQDFVPATSTKEYITFGNGGGITGAVTQYYLLKSGKLYFSPPGNDQLKYLGKVNKNTSQQLFLIYQKNKLDVMRINDPGNMYFFMQRHNTEKSNRLVWGGSNQDISPVVSTLFQNMMNLVKKLPVE